MKNTTPKKKTQLSKEVILTWYMQDILEGNDPKNVYLFSKNHKIQETDFYQFFNGFESIERHFFEILFDRTIQTLSKSAQYHEYPAKEKLLSFYYTFFGNLAANRSFILHLLSGHKFENISKLRGLHKVFLAFVETIQIEKIDLKNKELNKAQEKIIAESAWLQLVSILKFWINDDSADFEKTDIFIEKSTVAAFELINTKPLKSIADLGKFIFKEFNFAG